MNCKRCGFKNQFQNYCTNCIKFGKFENKPVKYIKRNNKNSKLVYEYPLTKQQDYIANQMARSKRDVLVNAVCGAGKTEIVTKEIEKFLSKGKRIGILIPRVELVKEFAFKLSKFFPQNKITLVYGNKKPELGDIVVMTCHKVYRFYNQLDLAIIDEVDAFPLSDDSALQSLCFNVARYKTIYLSATPPDYLPSDLLQLTLNTRFHGKPLPIPKVIQAFSLPNYLQKIMENNKKPLFVYFPTIKLQEEYYQNFKDKFNIGILNSKTQNKSKILNSFRNGELKIIFTTSVLERGVTFEGLDIVVINANHTLFTKDVLIQIAGRVGRKIFYETGNAIFLVSNNSWKIKSVIKEIKNKNALPDL